MVPRAGARSPVIRRKRVVLPAPFRPTIPQRSPGSTVKVTFCSRIVAPNSTPISAKERMDTAGIWRWRSGIRQPARGSRFSGAMLAYVFWHWKQPAVAVAEYEDAQRGFHAALAAEPPPGFHRSVSVALSGAPWAGAGGAAYEDWYLLDGMAALEPLNQAAVTASRRGPHDSAAALAAGGTAGLYALRAGPATEAPDRKSVV